MNFQMKHLDFAAKLTFFFVLIGLVLIAFLEGGVDFRCYYGAAVLVIEGGNPYNYTELAPVLVRLTGFAGGTPYFYPPWFILFILPFTLLTFQGARVAWLLVSAALFYAALRLIQAVLHKDLSGWKKYGLFLAASLNFAAYCLRSEQVGIVLLFVLGATLVAIEKKRSVIAGFGLVLLLIKPQVTLPFLVLLAAWLVLNQRRTFLWAGIWTVALLIVSSIAMPRWWQIEWDNFGMAIVYSLDGPELISAERVNSTLYDFTEFELYLDAPYSLILWSVVTLAGVAFLLLTWRYAPDIITRLSAVLLTTFLLTPYTVQYDYVLLLLPIFWILKYLAGQGLIVQIATVALLVFNLSVLLWQDWTYQGYWQVLAITLAFVVTLWGARNQLQMEAGMPMTPALDT